MNHDYQCLCCVSFGWSEAIAQESVAAKVLAQEAEQRAAAAAIAAPADTPPRPSGS